MRFQASKVVTARPIALGWRQRQRAKRGELLI
jgi:hypothetical protein